MDLTTFYSFRRRNLRGRGPDRRWLSGILFLVGLVGLILGAHVALFTPMETARIAFISALIAAVAILYNSLHSARQARIRFTLDATFQRLSNSVYAGHASAIYRFKDQILAATSVGALKELSTSKTANHDAPSVAESLTYVLNYWEFIATAYVDGHLDRETFADVIGQFIGTLVERAARFIGEVRREDGENWEHLTAVYFRFANDTDRGKYVPLLGPAPARLSPWECDEWARLLPKAS